MHNRFRISLSVLSTLIALSAITFGQQSKSPVITADDVLRVTRGRSRVNTPTPATDTTTGQTESRQSSVAERLWRERLQRAQQQVRELRRLADAAELETNRVRNMLYSGEPRAPRTHKGFIADIDNLTAEMRRLRAEAADAQANVDALLAEGEANGFSISPATARRAVTSRDEFRSRYGELNIDLLDAQRRADVLQLRANDISRRILLNSGTGDEFYASRLREQLQETEDELFDTRSRISGLRRSLDELRREARAVGVYLN